MVRECLRSGGAVAQLGERLTGSLFRSGAHRFDQCPCGRNACPHRVPNRVRKQRSTAFLPWLMFTPHTRGPAVTQGSRGRESAHQTAHARTPGATSPQGEMKCVRNPRGLQKFGPISVWCQGARPPSANRQPRGWVPDIRKNRKLCQGRPTAPSDSRGPAATWIPAVIILITLCVISVVRRGVGEERRSWPRRSRQRRRSPAGRVDRRGLEEKSELPIVSFEVAPACGLRDRW